MFFEVRYVDEGRSGWRRVDPEQEDQLHGRESPALSTVLCYTLKRHGRRGGTGTANRRMAEPFACRLVDHEPARPTPGGGNVIRGKGFGMPSARSIQSVLWQSSRPQAQISMYHLPCRSQRSNKPNPGVGLPHRRCQDTLGGSRRPGVFEAMPSPAAASSEPEGSGQRRFGASELQDIKHTYEQEGFVILDGLISLAELQKLRQAAEDVTTKTRAGQWPHRCVGVRFSVALRAELRFIDDRRTAKKQFPPWDDDDETDVWGCQHVWHPQLGHTRTFAGFYGSPGMLDVAQALMGCERQEMMISLFNMLVSILSGVSCRCSKVDRPHRSSHVRSPLFRQC